MTSGEQLYLLLVVATFCGFAAVLAWVTHTANANATPAKAAVAPSGATAHATH